MKKRKLTVLTAFLLAAVMSLSSGCSLLRGGGGGDDGGENESRKETTSSRTKKENDTDISKSIYKGDEGDGKHLYVTGVSDPIAVRETDEDNGKVLAQLNLGDEVTLLSADSATCYYVSVKDGDVEGYVKKNFLTDEKMAVCKNETGFISETTSLFDSRDDDRKELSKLQKNTAVVILSKNSGNFWYVNVKDTKNYGYVKCTNISDKKVEEASSKASSNNTSSKANTNNNDNNNNNKNNSGFRFGSGAAPQNYSLYYANVKTGYLAIRNAMKYDSSNELGQIQNGEAVYVVSTNTGNADYWYSYSPKLGIYGYVNKNYLTVGGNNANTNNNNNNNNGFRLGSGNYPNSYSVYYASVSSGYLAIRNAMKFDSSNELGQMQNGEEVLVVSTNTGNADYWYCYSPKLGIYGYVNKNYLTPGQGSTVTTTPSSGYEIWDTRVASGYLALRNAPSYNSSNEVAKLYNGDVVYVYSGTSYVNFTDTYWWVYSPKYDRWGYVDSNYIYKSNRN